MRRKNMIKKVFALTAALTLLTTLAACGNSDDNKNVEPGSTQVQVDQITCHAKYKEAMQNMLDNRVFPNGEQLYVNDGDEDSVWGDNQFAITDIDGDGMDELLINFNNAPVVGEVFYIFKYDQEKDAVTEEFSEFPAVDFFDNGYVTVGASHNQGLAGDFWPYEIYKYDADKDAYEMKYYIDAWSKEFFPEDFDGNPYPDAVDTSKTGLVYYIYEDLAKSVDPVDKSAYDKIVAETYGPAAEVTVDYKDITQENINAITSA